MPTFVTVAAYTTAIEARIISGRLEFEGIATAVVYEYHVSANWLVSVALGGVGVQVRAEDLNQATQVLNRINTEDYAAALELEFPSSETGSCPRCGAQSLVLQSWPLKLALVVMFLVYLPLPYTQYLMRCRQCTHQWVAASQRGYPFYIPVLAWLQLSSLFFVLYAVWFHWCSLYCESPFY